MIALLAPNPGCMVFNDKAPRFLIHGGRLLVCKLLVCVDVEVVFIHPVYVPLFFLTTGPRFLSLLLICRSVRSRNIFSTLV
jgi:hypothetical protein